MLARTNKPPECASFSDPYFRYVAVAKGQDKGPKREPGKAPALSKPPVSRRWRITLLKATPAKFIGYVRAPDEKSAIATAAKDYDVSERLVDRLVATPEDS
jgi:hypothetical protein